MVICVLKMIVFAVVHCHSCAKPIRRVQLQQPLIDNVRSNLRGKDTGEHIMHHIKWLCMYCYNNANDC